MKLQKHIDKAVATCGNNKQKLKLALFSIGLKFNAKAIYDPYFRKYWEQVKDIKL